MTDSDRLLLIRLGAVGDVLRTLPALHLIRETFPGLHIAWLVEELSHDLLSGHPEIDDLILFPRRVLAAGVRPIHAASRIASLARDLRRRRFTVAADFQGSFKSGALALLSGAGKRIGYAPGHCREMSFLFTNHWIRPHSRFINRVERNLLMSEAIGAAGDEVRMVLPEGPAEGRRADEMLRELAPDGESVVLLSPGTSGRQAYKRWPLERFARLAARMRTSLGVMPVVVWGPGEEQMARDIVRGSAGAARLPPPISLRLLAAVLRRSALFVGADTGPMHLAWGVGCPVVAIFGPTDPRLNAPLGPDHVILRGDAGTGSVSADEALGAARRVLERPAVRRPPAPPLLRSSLFRPSLAGPPP